MEDPWELVRLWAREASDPGTSVDALESLLDREGFIITRPTPRVVDAMHLDARDAIAGALEGMGWFDSADEAEPTP